MAAADITIRTIASAEADFELLAGIINAAYKTRYGHIMEGERTSPGDMAAEAGTESTILLAERGGALIGCAMIEAAAEFDLDGYGRDWGDPTDALYFGLAGVEPSAMNTGAGTRLVQEAESIAAAQGYRRVVLTTMREFGLPPYYERLGYRTLATEDFEAGHWTLNVPHQLHYMEKRL